MFTQLIQLIIDQCCELKRASLCSWISSHLTKRIRGYIATMRRVVSLSRDVDEKTRGRRGERERRR